MADSKIQWTDKTWNPVVGCTKVSAGCKNCYAKKLHDQRHKAHREGKAMPAQYAKPFEDVQLMPERLRDPLSWRKPQRVFVNSVSDLFHEDVPDAFLDRVFAVMALASRHTFQVLTKRAERMRAYFEDEDTCVRIALAAIEIDPMCWSDRRAGLFDLSRDEDGKVDGYAVDMPIPNVWLGVSVENQAEADHRIPHLLSTPAAVRFLSCEPLLGPVDLSNWLDPMRCELCGPGFKHQPVHVTSRNDVTRETVAGYELFCQECFADDPYAQSTVVHDETKLDWVIVGGESGRGVRPMNLAWMRGIVRQCQAAGVPVFVKQLGGLIHATNIVDPLDQFPGKVRKFGAGPGDDTIALGLIDRKGGEPAEWPEDLQVREFPARAA